MWFTTQLSDGIICRLFGGIKGSSIKIEKSEKSIDVWTSNEWYSVPLYYSIEKGHKGVIVTINDCLENTYATGQITGCCNETE